MTLRKPRYVYALPPIDCWDIWNTLADAAREDREFRRNTIEWFFCEARQIAPHLGWEGDVSQGPFWINLPVDEWNDQWLFAVAWKQSDNGLTFIASPVKMPWFEPRAFARFDDGEFIPPLKAKPRLIHADRGTVA